MLANNRWRAGRSPARSLRKNKSTRGDSGVTIVEYALLLALVAVLAVGSLVLLGNSVSNKLSNVAVQVASEGGSAPATQIILAGPPTDLASDDSEGFSATIEDASDIPVTGGQYSVAAVTFSTSGAGSVTPGTDQVNASGGVANVTITGATAGSVTIKATATLSNGTDTSNTITFTVVANPTEASLTFMPPYGQEPSATAKDAVAFGTQPSVAAVDKHGNVIITQTGTVTLSLAANATLGTLSCTSTATFNEGVAAFTGCEITGAAVTYTLNANATGGLTAPPSNGITLVPGDPTQLTFATPGTEPTSTGAGQPISPAPVAAILDTGGDLDTNLNTGNVTFSLFGGPAGATLTCGGTGTNGDTVPVSGGLAPSGGCSINDAATGYEIVGTYSPGDFVGNSNTFNVTAGPPSTLVFTTEPVGGVAGAALSTEPVVSVEDSQGNVVTNDTNAVSLSIASETPAGNGALSSCANVNFSSGVASFAGSGCTIINAPGTYTLRATDTGDGGLSTVSTSFVISGTATQIAFTQQPAGATAGAIFTQQPVVTVEDAEGNPVQSATGDVTLTLNYRFGGLPNGATLTCGGSGPNGDTVTVTNGQAAPTACKINVVGQYYYITASYNTFTADSGTFAVAGTPAQITFFGPNGQQPGNGSAGSPLSTQPIIAVEDTNGNLVTTATGNVTLALVIPAHGPAGAVLTCNGSGTNGDLIAVAGGLASPTCSVNDGDNGYRIQATYSTFSATSFTFNVVGAASQITFSDPNGQEPSGNSAAGTPFGTQPVVAIEDSSGNLVTTATGSVTLALVIPAGGPTGAILSCGGTGANGDLISVSGGLASPATCSVNDPYNGYKITATYESFTATSTAFDILGVSAITFNGAGTQPGDGAIGSPLSTQPAVALVDSFNQVVTGATGNVTLSLNEPFHGTGVLSCTGGLTLAVVNGLASPSGAGCSVSAAANGYSLHAVYNALTTNSDTFNVLGPSQITFLPPNGQQPAGAAVNKAFSQPPIIAVEDNEGDIETTASGTLTLSLNNPFGVHGALTCTNGLTVTVANGLAQPQGCSVSVAANNYSLHAAYTTFTANSADFNVVGPAAKLVFTTQPATSAVGTPLDSQPVVSVEDANNNVVTTATGSVTLALTGGTGGAVLTCSGSATNGDTFTLAAGVATASGCSVNTKGTGYKITATYTTFTATSNAFNIEGPAQLVFTDDIMYGEPGTALTEEPQVTIEDANGDTVTGDTASIKLTLTGGSLTCFANPASAVQGVANFTDCSVSAAGLYTITATDATDNITGTAYIFIF